MTTYPQNLQLLFALPLGGGECLVLASLVAQRLVGVGQLLLQLPSGPVSLVQQSARLLQGVLAGVRAAVSGNQQVMSGRFGARFLLESSLQKM